MNTQQRRRTNYHEIQARTILNRVRGMPFDWSVSAYRGCIHSCTYCYARATHPYLGHNPGADFEHEIYVKVNAVDLLRMEIQQPRMRHQQVVTGTVSDPYQPAEARYRLSRGMLFVLLENGNPVSVTTKSPLILRDLDVLSDFAQGPGCSVFVTITTIDRDTAHKLEPRAPSPEQRLTAVRKLSEAGIETGVFVGPVFPGLTDSPEHLHSLAAAVADAGGSFLAGLPLRIGNGFAQPFLEATARDFPQVIQRYRTQARRGGMDRTQVDTISAVFDDLRFRYGLNSQPQRRLPGLNQTQQLVLPLP